MARSWDSWHGMAWHGNPTVILHHLIPYSYQDPDINRPGKDNSNGNLPKGEPQHFLNTCKRLSMQWGHQVFCVPTQGSLPISSLKDSSTWVDLSIGLRPVGSVSWLFPLPASLRLEHAAQRAGSTLQYMNRSFILAPECMARGTSAPRKDEDGADCAAGR